METTNEQRDIDIQLSCDKGRQGSITGVTLPGRSKNVSEGRGTSRFAKHFESTDCICRNKPKICKSTTCTAFPPTHKSPILGIDGYVTTHELCDRKSTNTRYNEKDAYLVLCPWNGSPLCRTGSCQQFHRISSPTLLGFLHSLGSNSCCWPISLAGCTLEKVWCRNVPGAACMHSVHGNR